MNSLVTDLLLFFFADFCFTLTDCCAIVCLFKIRQVAFTALGPSNNSLFDFDYGFSLVKYSTS